MLPTDRLTIITPCQEEAVSNSCIIVIAIVTSDHVDPTFVLVKIEEREIRELVDIIKVNLYN